MLQKKWNTQRIDEEIEKKATKVEIWKQNNVNTLANQDKGKPHHDLSLQSASNSETLLRHTATRVFKDVYTGLVTN